MRILIIEDEVRLAEALAQILRQQKYAADAVYTGEDGLAYALSGQYDLVILDVMLPGLNGYEAVQKMRLQKNATPVLMLTAKDEISDKVAGLDCGADDYMTKPFVTEELLARVRALARRQGEVVLEQLSFGDLVLHLSTHELAGEKGSIHLGYKEFEVLKLLLSHPGMVVTKSMLIAKVWGMDSEVEDNNVEAYISFLRKKLSFLHSRVEIITLRKVGYRLEASK